MGITKYVLTNSLTKKTKSPSQVRREKYRIRETPTLSTDADSRTDTNLKRLRDLSFKKNKKNYRLRD